MIYEQFKTFRKRAESSNLLKDVIKMVNDTRQ